MGEKMKVIFFSTEKILVASRFTSEVGEPTSTMSGFQLAAPVSGKLKKKPRPLGGTELCTVKISAAALRLARYLCFHLQTRCSSISLSVTHPPTPSAVSCFMTGSRVDVSDAAVRLTPSPSPICQTPSPMVTGDNNRWNNAKIAAWASPLRNRAIWGVSSLIPFGFGRCWVGSSGHC